MKKRGFRISGIFLILAGVFLLANSFQINGFVVLDEIPQTAGSFLGIIFVIGGILLLMAKRKKEGGLATLVDKETYYVKVDPDYYRKRANELTKYKGDAWISQWEAEGVMKELDDKGYELEHGKRMPALHYGGHGPNIKHIKIASSDKSFKKHLYITSDPSDPKLRYVGVREITGNKLERVNSKVYHPMHPRHHAGKRRGYLDKTHVG